MTQVTKQFSYKKFILGGVFALALIMFLSLTLKATWVISQINVSGAEGDYELFKAFAQKNSEFSSLILPEKEPDRLDILVLGIRGFGEEFGALLTDTILLISVDKNTQNVAIVSIPRDLYITLPYNGKVKINELYSIGYDKGGEALGLTVVKTVVSQITGVHVDSAVRVDFQGFIKLVDLVGGVDLYLNEPFAELEQWSGVGGFSLPKGWNHLDGEAALFYARSRFSTSDFDRARRQQEIILALKEKIIAAGILANPVKVYGILDAIGAHVRTDTDIEISEVIAMANQLDYSNVKRLVLTTENYLYQSATPNGAYILLPRDDTFHEIQTLLQSMFTQETFPPSAFPPRPYERPRNTDNAPSHPTSTPPTS